MRSAGRTAALIATWAVLGFGTRVAQADASEAASLFRVAQRLAAERSPAAAAAYEKAIAADPAGPIVDDALLGLARLQAIPEWPEDLDGLDASRAAAATAALSRLLDARPPGRRTLEARYLLALIRLAPLPGRDATRARTDLIAIASQPADERFVDAARYTLGVLDEQAGEHERAAGTFARVVIERPEGDAALRAGSGLARTLLVAGKYGEAAVAFQRLAESTWAGAGRAVVLRDAALREALGARAHRWAEPLAPLQTFPTARGAIRVAASGGGVLVYDDKARALQAFDLRGSGSPPIPAEDVTALACDPYGRAYAVSGDRLLRIDPRGPAVVATLGAFARGSALAVDASGTAWVADRKGDRIARFAPGATAPEIVRESRGAGICALAVRDGRILAAEEKTGRLIEIAGPGRERPWGEATFRKPAAIAVDLAGQVAVLDAREETVTLLARDGTIRDTLALTETNVEKPVGLATTADGSLRILDEANGFVASAP